MNTREYALIGIIIAVLVLVPVFGLSQIHGIPPKYYAYGDSVTRANEIMFGLSPDGTDSYVAIIASEYDNGSSYQRDLDGGGMSSTWGAGNISGHYVPGTKYFLYMFTNDGWCIVDDETTVRNYITIYDYVAANGTVPIPMVPILTMRNSSEEYNQSSQERRIALLEKELTARGIRFIPLYDALDSVPNNGELDKINVSTMPDHIHPDKEGHRLMAAYIWEWMKKEAIIRGEKNVQ